MMRLRSCCRWRSVWRNWTRLTASWAKAERSAGRAAISRTYDDVPRPNTRPANIQFFEWLRRDCDSFRPAAQLSGSVTDLPQRRRLACFEQTKIASVIFGCGQPFDLATGLGLTGLIVSPAFGYAGVGFPILGMNAFALFWGAILPLRWYMAVLLGQAARGLPLYESARPFAVLAALAALYTLLAFLRLRAIAASTSPTAPEAEPAAASVPSRGLGGAFVAEWRRVLGIRGAFMLLVVGPLVYGLYYPQPYLNQILRKIPIAVVDNDLSELSRNIVQTLDASGAVSVAVHADTLGQAQAALDRGEAFAVVGIPPGTQRDVLKGIAAHIPIYADATYLFLFRSTG